MPGGAGQRSLPDETHGAMVAAILISVLALAIFGLVNFIVPYAERAKMLGMLLFGYFLRLFLFLFVMRSVAFFSHGVAGGDSQIYEHLGSMVAMIWRANGVHFVTAAELPEVGGVALLINMLGLIEYVGGEASPLAGTAINAFVAAWAVLIFYRFVLDMGTERRAAAWASALLLFGPSFLYHTSDTYKDGLNAFLVLASLLGSIRLSQRFEWWRVGALALSLLALWYIRHYMVFMCLLPLVVGVLGTGKASAFRRVAAFFLVVALGLAAGYSGALSTAFGSAGDTFTLATSETVLNYNATITVGGSGVITDSYFVRLVYTLLAPFPWQLGSLGMQLGKLESFLCYFFIYRAIRGRRLLWDKHQATTLMLLIFIIPATLAYAATMSNVGLIVRQRMPIVICLAILAALTMNEVRSQVRPMASAKTPLPPIRATRRPPVATRPRDEQPDGGPASAQTSPSQTPRPAS